MKKRIIRKFFVSIIVLLLFITGFIVYNTMNRCDYNYHVNEDGKTITLDKYIGKDEEVIIPDNINGKTVTVIGTWCFKNNETIKSVYVPETIRQIGIGAFSICHKLERVSGGENLCHVGFGAFTMCDKLSEIPSFEKVDIIEDGVFRGCKRIINIKLSDSLSYIGSCAFEYTCIDYDVIPNSVERIGGAAFEETPKVRENNDYIFVGNDILLEYPNIEIVIVPEGVRFVAFNRVKENVREMYLPNSVECLDANICERTGGAIIYIPENVKQIGDFSSNTFKEKKMEDVRCIFGIEGSYAQEYAGRYGIKFEAVEPWY